MVEILKKKRKLLLCNHLSPGDVVAMTAAVRDLHRKYPNEYITDVDTSAREIWENNPYLTKLPWRTELLNGQTEPGNSLEVLQPKHGLKVIREDPDIEVLDLNYNGNYPASINNSNTFAYHFVHGYVQDLALLLGVDIPTTEFKGDIYISEQEKMWYSQIEEMKIRDNFWVVAAGGKRDYTAKWWDPVRYQQVVDYFQGKILFVQTGDPNHFHTPLTNCIDLLGKTSTRQLIRLVYHSDGVLCGVTFLMHLAAAVPMREFDNRGRRKAVNRAAVVVAGGREPSQWEAYPHHQFIHNNGALPCCLQGGCWRSRCQTVGDGDPKDSEGLCVYPVQLSPSLRIPKCMDMISADEVIRRIKVYYEGGAYQYNHWDV